jgi:hypothetical protein
MASGCREKINYFTNFAWLRQRWTKLSVQLVFREARTAKGESLFNMSATSRYVDYYRPIFLITLLKAGGEKSYSLSVGFLF